MLECYLVDTPIEFNAKLGNPVDKEKYQGLVRKLIYLSRTRLDIFYVVSTISQFMQTPYKEHTEVVNRILLYLKATPGK